jgi:glycosyl transferase family 2
VDVVVPFRGGRSELEELRARLKALRLRSGDTIVVVDNTPGGEPHDGPIPVLSAAEHATPGYARNRGAARGDAEWLVFIDADTDPSPDLLDSYFDPLPAPGTVLLAGGVIDEAVPVDAPAPARYAYLRGTLSQNRTLSLGEWAFAQTANVACRRVAFERIGGFRETIRAAEDADLSYRLKGGGGEIERRENAAVVHHNRRALRPFVAQALLHGAGSAWLNRNYPGSFPRRGRLGLVWWALRTSTRGIFDSVRRGDRDQLVRGLFGSVWELSFELGRLFSVERPRRVRHR